MGFTHGWSRMMLGVIPMSFIEVYVGFCEKIAKLENQKNWAKKGLRRGEEKPRLGEAEGQKMAPFWPA